MFKCLITSVIIQVHLHWYLHTPRAADPQLPEHRLTVPHLQPEVQRDAEALRGRASNGG